MKSLLRKIGRTEIVLAISAVIVALTTANDLIGEGLDAGSIVRAALVAGGAFIMRSQVFSKETVEG